MPDIEPTAPPNTAGELSPGDSSINGSNDPAQPMLPYGAVVHPPSRTNDSVVTSEQLAQQTAFDRALFAVVVVLLTAMLAGMSLSLIFQYRNYQTAVSMMAQGKHGEYTGVLVLSRAWDFAVVKTSALFMAFILILLGALYVLRIASVAYSASAGTDKVKGELQTSSPGLVMVTLGAILVALTLYSKTTIEWSGSPAATGGPVVNDPVRVDQGVTDKPKQ